MAQNVGIFRRKKHFHDLCIIFFFIETLSITRKAFRYNLAERKPMRSETCLSIVKV